MQTFEAMGLTRTALRPADVDRALRLSREAGWNQVAADWRLMIDAGEALGVWTGGDARLVASALTLPFDGPFAWISMVLVTADFRHRGIATRLLRECLERAAALDRTAGLDATPAGREVYLPLGFRAVYGLSRRLATTPPRMAASRNADAAVRPVRTDDLDRLVRYDRARFGAERGTILRHLIERVPQRAFVAERGAEVIGFALARDGRDAHHLGPVLADDWPVARCLVERALTGVERSVYVDVPNHQTAFSGWLERQGFVTQRPYTRMLFERAEPYDTPEQVFAIAGPELG